MLNPSSKLRAVARGGLRRRPSAAMGVSLVALFVALSGGAYAAVTIPDHSVGANQLKTFAVTNPKLANNAVGSRKIMPGAVGFYRVNRSEVQLRVTGSCTGADQAITSVSITGSTTCGDTSPSEFDSGAATAKALSTTATSLASFTLAGGSQYMVQADPYITVSANTDTTAQTVDVSCTLAAGTATTATETRSVSVYVPAAHTTAAASIPLTVIQPESATSTTASLSCIDTDTGGITDATLDGQGTVYATTLAPPATTTTTTTTTAAVRH